MYKNCLINSTLSSGKLPESLTDKCAVCTYFASSFFFRPVSLLLISNISSFRLLTLHVGKPLFTDSSIIPLCKWGAVSLVPRLLSEKLRQLVIFLKKVWYQTRVWFSLGCFFPHPPSLSCMKQVPFKSTGIRLHHMQCVHRTGCERHTVVASRKMLVQSKHKQSTTDGLCGLSHEKSYYPV